MSAPHEDSSMKNFVQNGQTIGYTAGANITSGQAILIGAMLGIAATDIANGSVGIMAVEGVYTITSLTGTAWAQGAQLYWDDTNKRVTNVASGNTACGKCLNTKASADATCLVKINA